jgi:hypothetical protein
VRACCWRSCYSPPAEQLSAMTALPFIVIGNPENRRVTMFQQALVARGCPPATVISYLELLADPGQLAELPDEPALVRIDSAGESFEVERGMLRLGHEDAVSAGVSTIEPGAVDRLEEDRGRILCPRQAHLGFVRLLRRLESIFADRHNWRLLNTPATIVELFDKRLTSKRYAAAGLPVPPVLEGIESPGELRAAMHERGWTSAFVKLACSSSASCLAVYHLREEAEFVMTTVEMAEKAWYNSLRVRRINDRQRIDELLVFLLREGSQIERQVPKARLDGAFFDCRVLCVDGDPAFSVVRQNRHPITNLHLGGWRGDPAALQARLPPELHEAAMESCRAVAAMHNSFQLGVDLLYEAAFAGHRVVEANAFGDLLPNLTREGLSVYEWEIRAAFARYS